MPIVFIHGVNTREGPSYKAEREVMRDWARNLANRFPKIPDGCIIWASQGMYQRQDREEAWTYFGKAINRGMPIYTEGLRLLTKNLRGIGEQGHEALRQLDNETGHVIWTSPFTARQIRCSSGSQKPVFYDIGFAPRVTPGTTSSNKGKRSFEFGYHSWVSFHKSQKEPRW